jgi:DNA-binding response OmpR family regulator
MLMQRRQLVLERNGHSVVGVMDEKALTAACENQTFAVAVISHKLSARMKQHVALLLRNHCPEIKILELYDTGNGPAIDDADSWIGNPVVPQELVSRIAALTKRSTIHFSNPSKRAHK